MFEKEARKWVKENTKIDYKASYGEFPIEPSATKSFKAGAEFGYNKAKEEINQKGLALQSDMDETIKQNVALEKENAGLKTRLNAINLLTPELEKSSKSKSQRLAYAKTIIKDLLDNSDEYARQRAIEFIKEN